MARTSAGHQTREKLLRAAEQLFATRGVEAALTRDITRLAGQGNPSAVQYHFGSREGLLDAIMAGSRDRTERALAPWLPGLDGAALPELLGALITAEATELRTGRGRHCLRISAQLGHAGGVRPGSPWPPQAGGGHRAVIRLVENRILNLPEPIRLERIDHVLTLVCAALAGRAQQYLSDTVPLTDEETFLADLTVVSAAMLAAPAPATALSSCRR
ncbi:TetR/AcrR family transcriptional regulator [Kitasatospora sp. NBC_00315]|uniref:TetR/AcrR family transcriptional regulator n=1 Tax=Kitasatospora sp. NBC_00315 TaxID=2975963 RepID=UPI0032443FC8